MKPKIGIPVGRPLIGIPVMAVLFCLCQLYCEPAEEKAIIAQEKAIIAQEKAIRAMNLLRQRVPEDAINIVDKGDGWLTFELDGNKYLFRHGGTGHRGWEAITVIPD